MENRESIFALSSGRLPAGVAVVRLSGPAIRGTLERLIGKVPDQRRLVRATLRLGDRAPIDHGLAVFFPAPASFTGEDCAELHLHGGRAVVAAVLAALHDLPGMRPAQPGEFTRRAFLNGKLDLVEAEALADLIAAETEGARRLAFDGAGGRQSALYQGWRAELLELRAQIEAELDFSDQEDVPGTIGSGVWETIGRLQQQMAAHIEGFRRAEMIRDGYTVVIVGAPNVGKSSLLNRLAGRDAAIVADEPGTTRDAIEVTLDLDGAKVRLIDTAGLRDNAGRVEALGIARTQALARDADLIVALAEPLGPQPPPVAGDAPVLPVGAKSDLYRHRSGAGLQVSGLTGEGVPELLAALAARATAAIGDLGDILPARQRHVSHLRQALAALEAAGTGHPETLELVAEELRLAADSLGRIVGAIAPDEVLGAIFARFCIGK